MSPEIQVSAVVDTLGAYADAHAALPVHNRAQWLAREAAVAVGRQDWSRAKQCLEALRSIFRDPDL